MTFQETADYDRTVQEKYEYDPPEQHLVQKNDIFCTWVPRASPGPSGVVAESAYVF